MRSGSLQSAANPNNAAIGQGAALLAATFPTPQYNIGAPFGAQCANVADVTCTSHEWAIVNYLNYTHDPHNIWTWRSDYLNDTTGQRTGFKGSFAEFDLSYTHWVGDAIELMAAGGVKRRQEQLPAFGWQIEIVDQDPDHELVVFVVTGGRSYIQIVDPVGVAEIEQEGGSDRTLWGKGGKRSFFVQ